MKRKSEKHASGSNTSKPAAVTPPTPRNGLNDNHKNRLQQTFEYVDRVLCNALRELDVPEKPTLFQRCIPDSSPVQRKNLTGYVAHLHRTMAAIMNRHDIAPREPTVSALWSFRTALMDARTAIEELAPTYMRGYGELSAEAAHDLDAVATELCSLLDQMDGYLAGRRGKDVRESQ